MEKITEQASRYRDIEKMSNAKILQSINDEDAGVAKAVRATIPVIDLLVDAAASRLRAGGRMFYTGAGTSGRLGVLDASECPPTYGVPDTMVTGIMAGGDLALRLGIEDAEDSREQGWADLQKNGISNSDIVIGIAASGTTPYVIGALEQARLRGIATGCIVCNPGSPVAAQADFAIEVLVGPEFITGSTRMKSGTAQKMILNMISTCVMIRLDKVRDNRMVNMQITNDKLIDRGTRMLMQNTGINNYDHAKDMLLKYGSVKAAMDAI